MLKKKINKIFFKFFDKIFPPYYQFRLGNKVKCFFLKHFIDYRGKKINLGKNLQIPYDLKIGDESGIGNYAKIGNGVTIGKNVMMGRNVNILTQNHKTSRIDIPMSKQGKENVIPLVIEDDVWIGDSVIILPNCKIIRKGTIIGAGAVVTKDFPEYSVIGGNPAKLLKSRKE